MVIFHSYVKLPEATEVNSNGGTNSCMVYSGISENHMGDLGVPLLWETYIYIHIQYIFILSETNYFTSWRLIVLNKEVITLVISGLILLISLIIRDIT